MNCYFAHYKSHLNETFITRHDVQKQGNEQIRMCHREQVNGLRFILITIIASESVFE